MSQPAIQVEALSKRYKIGHLYHQRKDTLRDALTQGIKGLGARLANPKATLAQRNYDDFWALRDMSFTLQQGDRLGIIGRNGAGKSTLLKILSRITQPTSGRAIIRGRLASLLEVGTGFHPELSGRDNIYLNGAILGMHKWEIAKKFDEIVAFSGVEQFLDTPVKRYSSGMYVRLAFAVSAHLEPDVLIVDEVLAVGDAEFQKKCMGKMQDVSREGRTILFVSHNLSAVMGLCNKGLLINNGTNVAYGDVREVADQYLTQIGEVNETVYEHADFNEHAHIIKKVELLDADMQPQSRFEYGQKMHVRVTTNPKFSSPFSFELRWKNGKGEDVGYASCWISHGDNNVMYAPGDVLLATLPALKLAEDLYILDVFTRTQNAYPIDGILNTIQFMITHCQPQGSPVWVRRTGHLGNVVFDDVKFEKIGSLTVGS